MNAIGSIKIMDINRQHLLVITESHPNGATSIVLQPRPTADPNDPLVSLLDIAMFAANADDIKNWSRARKSLNFGIAVFYALLIFALSVIPLLVPCSLTALLIPLQN